MINDGVPHIILVQNIRRNPVRIFEAQKLAVEKHFVRFGFSYGSTEACLCCDAVDLDECMLDRCWIVGAAVVGSSLYLRVRYCYFQFLHFLSHFKQCIGSKQRVCVCVRAHACIRGAFGCPGLEMALRPRPSLMNEYE